MSDDLELTPELVLDLWYQALNTELGITFNVDPKDIENVKNKLYQARKDIGDPRLQEFSIHVPSDSSVISIYRKDMKGNLP